MSDATTVQAGPAYDKPIVRYAGAAIRINDRALLAPIDHANHAPGQMVSNTKVALTSTVVTWLGDRIETRNTVYIRDRSYDTKEGQ